MVLVSLSEVILCLKIKYVVFTKFVSKMMQNYFQNHPQPTLLPRRGFTRPVPACSGASGVNPWITGWALARPGSRWCVGIGLNIMEIWKLSAASREAHGGENVKSKAKGFEKKTVKHLKNISLNKINWDFGAFVNGIHVYVRREWIAFIFYLSPMGCLYLRQRWGLNKDWKE